jgi:hypothetical protein
MATLDEAGEIALSLPGVTEGERHGNRAWSVAGRVFAWDRQFSKADVRRYGDEAPPDGPVLAVRTADLAEEEAVLGAGHHGIFTIPHFDGYAAVLIQLRVVAAGSLRETIEDGWLACAPAELAREYVSRGPAR